MKELKDKLIAALKKSAADLVACGNIERMTDPAVKKLFPEAKTVICVAFRQLRGTRRGIEEGTVFYQYSTSVETLEEVMIPAVTANTTSGEVDISCDTDPASAVRFHLNTVSGDICVS